MRLYYVFSFAFLLFGFKVVLLPVGSTGVRLEDFLAAGLFFLMCLSLIKCYSSISKVKTAVVIYLCFILVNFISGVLNAYLGKVSLLESSLFTFRLFEYLIFFYLGVQLAGRGVNFASYFKIYIVFVFFVHVLQLSGILGGANDFAFDRASANTNGPYELAVIAGLLFFFFRGREEFFWAFLSLCIVILTASRISSLAILLIVFFEYLWRFRHIRVNPGFVFFGGVACVTLMFVIDFDTLFDLPVVSRTSELVSSQTLDSIYVIYSNSVAVTTQSEYFHLAYGDNMSSVLDLDGDGSALIRFSRWLLLIKSVFSTEWAVLFGLGPSFASVAVDGYYVRLLAESGVAGVVLFLMFSICILRSKYSRVFREYFALLFITGFFIDIFVALKPMALFWCYFGVECYNAKFRAGKV